MTGLEAQLALDRVWKASPQHSSTHYYSYLTYEGYLVAKAFSEAADALATELP